MYNRYIPAGGYVRASEEEGAPPPRPGASGPRRARGSSPAELLGRLAGGGLAGAVRGLGLDRLDSGDILLLLIILLIFLEGEDMDLVIALGLILLLGLGDGERGGQES